MNPSPRPFGCDGTARLMSKHRICFWVILLIPAFVLAACLPIPSHGEVEDVDIPFYEEALLSGDEAVVVMGGTSDPDGEESVVECIRGKLREADPPVRVLPVRALRDALSPWFEDLSPYRSNEDYAALLTPQPARQAISDLNARHLIYVDSTTTEGQSEGVEAIIAGAVGFKETTRVRARILDLKAARLLGTAQVTAVGDEGYVHFMIYGVLLLAATEGTACDELGHQLAAVFRGRDIAALFPPAGDGHLDPSAHYRDGR